MAVDVVVSELAADDFGFPLVEEVVAYDSPRVVVVDLDPSVAGRTVSIDEANVSVVYLRVCRSRQRPCRGEHCKAQHDAVWLAVGRSGATPEGGLDGGCGKRASGGCKMEIAHSMLLVPRSGVNVSVTGGSGSRSDRR